METATLIIETLTQLGVTLRANGDRLRIEPASKVPADLLPRIREVKVEILAALSQPAPAHAPYGPCYTCGSRLFWRSIHGPIICYRCHPPASEGLVKSLLYDGQVKWKM